MREIKFRAWDKKEKIMYYSPNLAEHDKDAINWWAMLEDNETWEDKSGFDIELMQYTGLKDKSGKEVYEGDIIIFKHKPGSMIIRDFEDPDVNTRIIGWCEEEAEYCFTWINGKGQTSGSTFGKNNLSTIVEVIGNINENKE